MDSLDFTRFYALANSIAWYKVSSDMVLYEYVLSLEKAITGDIPLGTLYDYRRKAIEADDLESFLFIIHRDVYYRG